LVIKHIGSTAPNDKKARSARIRAICFIKLEHQFSLENPNERRRTQKREVNGE
jgi:hypothetical protein